MAETEQAHGLAMCGLHSEVVHVRLKMHDDSELVGGLGPDVGVNLGIIHPEARSDNTF